MDFSTAQLVAISAIFVWSGFVRAGLGFGGAALALPLLLMVIDQPLFFLPIIATHLLIFSSITAGRGFRNIDRAFLKESLSWMIIPKLVGVIGLLSLPNDWMVWIIYAITGFYAITWILKWEIRSQSPWVDRLLFIVGGYFSGVSLIGAPLIIAVAVRKMAKETYRTLVHPCRHKDVGLCYCRCGSAVAMVTHAIVAHHHRPPDGIKIPSTNAKG